MFSAATPRRSRLAYSTLALMLAGAAGIINATGFFAFGQHLTHMTGHITAVGEAIASGQWSGARLASQLVLAFIVGAITATALLDASRHRQRGRHAGALLVELVALGGVGLWVREHPDSTEPTLMWSLAFAMGLQNALVTRVSGAVVRTTHLTGVLTDIGIQVVRMAVWVRDGARERGLRGVWRKVMDLPSAEQFERTRLHLGLTFAFLVGSIAGSALYLRYGAQAMAMPCVVVLLVMALDLSPAGSHTPATNL